MTPEEIIKKYMPFMDSYDMTDDQKREVIELRRATTDTPFRKTAPKARAKRVVELSGVEPLTSSMP